MISTKAGDRLCNYLRAAQADFTPDMIEAVEDEATFAALAAMDIAALRTKIEKLPVMHNDAEQVTFAGASGDYLDREQVLALLR